MLSRSLSNGIRYDAMTAGSAGPTAAVFASLLLGEAIRNVKVFVSSRVRREEASGSDGN
jgi:hypothetical protein